MRNNSKIKIYSPFIKRINNLYAAILSPVLLLPNLTLRSNASHKGEMSILPKLNAVYTNKDNMNQHWDTSSKLIYANVILFTIC